MRSRTREIVAAQSFERRKQGFTPSKKFDKVAENRSPARAKKGLMKNCLAVFSVFFALLVPSLRAQNEGAISGTVQDSTGAVLPNATVKLTHHDRSEEHTSE